MSTKTLRHAVNRGTLTGVLVLRSENDGDFLHRRQQPAAPQSDTNILQNEVRS